MAKYFTVKQFAAKNKDRGTWPDTATTIWSIRAKIPQNGFGNAFITLGKRVLIIEHKFWEAVDLQQKVNNSDP